MSLDLYEKEINEAVGARTLTTMPEVTAWDGFARGAGMTAMQTFAKAGRSASMALAAVPVAVDAFTDGTELQDKYFRQHDELFGDAADYWTPKPGEVGVAGQITGQLLATLPMVIANPAAAVAATQMSVTEDLARKDVDPTKAVAVGAVQGAGLGLGIFVPVLGKTLAQRVLLGGAGFNVFQGVATRGASEAILGSSAAAAEHQAFDSTAITLDVLMGLAFGGIAHLSPAQRAQGAEFLGRLDAWAKNIEPSKVDALMVMRQAQHMNADSLPGRPTGPEDVTAHVERTRQAIDQLARDQKVDVSDIPEGKYEIDEPRIQEMAVRAEEMVRLADDARKAEGLPSEDGIAEFAAKAGEEIGGVSHLRGIVESLQRTYIEQGPEAGRVLLDQRAANAPEFSGFADEVRLKGFVDELDAELARRARQFLQRTEAPPAPRGAEPPPPRSDEGRPGGAEAEGGTVRAPEIEEARAFATERGDVEITVGRDADGQPIRKNLKAFLDESDDQVKVATEDAKLFEVAALCMLGGA